MAAMITTSQLKSNASGSRVLARRMYRTDWKESVQKRNYTAVDIRLDVSILTAHFLFSSKQIMIQGGKVETSQVILA